MLQGLFDDCTLQYPTRWPGSFKLGRCPDDRRSTLERKTGVWEFRGRTAETGLYVPKSLVDAGRLPANLEDYPPEKVSVTPSGSPLYDHQLRSVTFLRQVDREKEGVILGATMGAGKTITALHALYLDGFLKQPGLICGPLPSRAAWCGPESDAGKHYYINVLPLEGKKDIQSAILRKGLHFFCHYDILSAWWTHIFSVLSPTWVVFDELHLVCTGRTARAKAARNAALCSTVQRRYGLTGTPIPNRRLELWSQLSIVQPRQWGLNSDKFGLEFCGARRLTFEEGRGKWAYEGDTNTDELRARLAGTLLRYTKEEISDQLPPLRRIPIHLQISDPKAWQDYHAARKNVIKFLAEQRGETLAAKRPRSMFCINIEDETKKKGASKLVAITTLISLLSEMKKEHAVQQALEICKSHDRLVVFTWRIDTAAWITEELRKLAPPGTNVVGPVDGTMLQEKRIELAKEFAKSQKAIYVATRGAAGISINQLAAASAALFVDLYWNTAALAQAEDRVHRLGSTADLVEIYYLVVKNSIDDFIMNKLQQKAAAVVEVTPNDTLGRSMIRDLTPVNTVDEVFNLDDFCAALMKAA